MDRSIEQLLGTPEGKTLEFKQDLSSPRNIVKSLIAFANTAGGYLLIGISDDHQVVGVEQPLDEEERLTSILADSIRPKLLPNIELITCQQKTLLVVEVFPSSLRPHYVQSEGIENGVYVRLGSSNRKADPQLTSELQRSAAGIVFDEQPHPALSRSDLDLQSAQTLFSDQHKLNDKALQTLRILTREQGRLVPTTGAILLFGKDREQHFPDAWVQCGRFVGKDKSKIFDHIEIHTSLPESVEQIITFLQKHAMRGADFSELKRKDVWSIPLVILREAVVNALVHADYSQIGGPIRISFFDNRIEVENPGILLPGMTVEDMKQGVSRIRNRVIARVFRELNLIEQWGSGIRRIFSEAKELGLPEPVIEEIGMRVRFTVFFKEPLVPGGQQPGPGAQSRAQSGAQSTQILLLLAETSMSAADLVSALGLESKTGAFKRAIKDMLDQQLIAYTMPEKPTSRLQKYQITKEGVMRLQSLKEKGEDNRG